MAKKYDFSGWVTRNDLLCGDGRVIKRDAFKECDGTTVPLVWNHNHTDLNAVLGHCDLRNTDEGVYGYCVFNDSEDGIEAKRRVKHGDLRSLSIYANHLKQHGADVVHGMIREVSLVIGGANPGAYVDFVMAQGEDAEDSYGMEACYDENTIVLYHSDDEPEEEPEKEPEKEPDKEPEEEPIEHSDDGKEEKEMADENKKTVQEIFDAMTEEQQEAVYAIVGAAIEDKEGESKEDNMKHNIFEADTRKNNVLMHSDEEAILKLAKQSSVGSFQEAYKAYINENFLQHDDGDEPETPAYPGIFDNDTTESLFPEYKLIDPAEPKILYDDDSWVGSVIAGVHKSPISRVRTRRADARKSQLDAELKAKGYTKGAEKTVMEQMKLLSRTHDPQTIYIKDALNRDDIVDITDFDYVAYNWKVMRHTLDQTIAEAILIGDGRLDNDPDKIDETHVRPIWHDNDLYCIHQDVDIAAAKQELQGSDTGKHFGDNYVYAEAIITAALYARESYKGSGNLTFYCTPHLLNVMLLARDLNGRRIYTSKQDLVAALNVKDIKTVEQFENLTRIEGTGLGAKTKKLLGLFVNLADYQVGCVRGGEITKFEQFDIDFNRQKMLLETRISGALTEWYSAIALEEDVTPGPDDDDDANGGLGG